MKKKLLPLLSLFFISSLVFSESTTTKSNQKNLNKALLEAVKTNATDTMSQLLNKGANPNQVFDGKSVFLHAYLSSPSLFNLLLKNAKTISNNSMFELLKAAVLQKDSETEHLLERANFQIYMACLEKGLFCPKSRSFI